MEKYDTYRTTDSDAQRIDLHKNFRSREEVLSCTNDIFYKIMARDLGNVEYDREAALYPGAAYPDAEDDKMFAPEILVLDSSDELLDDEEHADAVAGDKKLLEAKLVAGRIKQIMREQKVTDKVTGELRPARYSDIVILLRSLSGWADAFAAVLNDAGIPAHTVLATGYFSAVEVQTVLSMLRILDNPRQDIPLAAVLRSPIVGMTDEELALLRLTDREESFHDCVLRKCEELCERRKEAEENTDVADVDEDENTCDIDSKADRVIQFEFYEQKLYDFYTMYLQLRKLVPDTPIHELIEIILKETGYGNYAAAMPAGKRRRANLEMLVEKAIAYENTSYKGLFHFVRYIDELQKYDVDFGEADMTGENEDVVRIMSIHKSKGLEFPIVFVSGLGKNFNRQDVRSRMVLHPEFGMGLDCMDGERRIKSATIAKKAIAKQIDLENLGEELRVLYVALTRAKEKLILTGCRKDVTGFIEQEKITVQMQSGAGVTADNSNETEGLPPLYYADRESAAGYLDWLIPAVLSYGERYDLRIVSVAELVADEAEESVCRILNREERMQAIAHADKALVEELEQRFVFRYPYEGASEQKNKYSVSELKHRAMREKLQQEEADVTPSFMQEEMVPYIPAFARNAAEAESAVNQGALRGTAVHRVMECYDFASDMPVKQQVEKMLAEGRITDEMRNLVKLPLVETFMASKLGTRMKAAEQAGKLHREKAFVMGFTSEELAKFGFGVMQTDIASMDMTDEKHRMQSTDMGDDLTLIQGIIDVFWEEEDGIVVLDYKTDRVDTGKQLSDRYAAQLALYGEALERIYNPDENRAIKVKERILYSFRLGEVVPV